MRSTSGERGRWPRRGGSIDDHAGSSSTPTTAPSRPTTSRVANLPMQDDWMSKVEESSRQ
ncbi:hypothetical protein E2562_000058 [Oryza meyeriana var. granulata]|uniref:Uncharacterized protein n=1 Tax=Oryza meyeriana var. granulata TaxID=110450 RepID=A0A6G1DC36_9ORYZ|nr:hypothetical protein E2562_000058 [Oryza meyeriana var. granulata]